MSIEDALFLDLRGDTPLSFDSAEAVVQAGFRAVLVQDDQLNGDPTAFRRSMDRAGLQHILVALRHASAEDLERIEAYEPKGLLLSVGGSFDLAQLRTLSLTAAELGLRFSLLPEAGSAFEARMLGADRPGPFTLALRTDRMLAEGRRPADFRSFGEDDLGALILTDQHVRGLQAGELALPGLGHLTLAPLVALLARKGFTGPWIVSRGEGLALADAPLARHALLNLLDQASQSEPALIEAREILPPRVQAKGFEFIELAVDEESRKEVERLLRALSFRCERRHKTAPVELWRQGAINLVLNAEIVAEGQRPFVCDMGLRVDDAQVSAQRAGMLGAHHHAPSRLPGRLPIPAMKDSLGTIVHFIDQKSDTHRVWDIEFDPIPLSETPWPAGLRRVDHMAQVMPGQAMEGLMLYYLSTFGLTKRTQLGMPDPAGPVASQALETPEGEVRIALNGVSEAAVSATSVQHVAFQSDDLLETAEILAEQGFERLPVPASYYADLADRFDFETGVLEALEAAGVLYDRDETGGEFLQLYSLPLSSGLFFEIVERRGGYSGYGAANSPVRRTALVQAINSTPAPSPVTEASPSTI